MNRELYNWRRKWLWLRYAHSFHWAHKPLCSRFAKDVLKVGHVHLCRSCTFLWLGGIVISLAALMLPVLRANIILIALPLLVVTLLLSAPRFYKKWPRPVRDGLRFSLGASIPLWLCMMLMGNLLLGIGTLAAGLLLWKLYSNSRKVRKLNACEGCPEFGLPKICSGCTLQAAQIRLYEEEATELFINSGQRPF